MTAVRGPRTLAAVLGTLLVVSFGLAWLVALRGASGGRLVDDRADLIAAPSERRLEAMSRAVLEEAGIELRTVTLPSLGGGDLFELSQSLFDELGVGDRTGANRGLLLIVAAAEQRVRLTVSYELEELYPDAFVGYVERQQMAPYFGDGLVGEGIEATVELILGRAFDRVGRRPGEGEELAVAPPGGERQGGAGAEAAVPFTGAPGSDRTPLPPDEGTRYGPQPTAELAWSRFLEIQRRRIKDPRLGIYDPASQQILLARPNSDAGQDHLARLYADARYEIRSAGDRAAVVFPDDPDHLLAPWFFRRSPAGWQLDGTMYPGVIGYNHRNQWRFKTGDHPYTFAFHDYTLDEHGFAFRR